VFRSAEEPKLIFDYLENKDKKGYFNIKHGSNADLAKVGRMVHTCRMSSGTEKTEDIEVPGVELHASLTGSNGKTQFSPHSKSSEISKNYEIFEPEKKELVRSKALRQLEMQQNGRPSVLNHSESVQFMRQMIQNESFSNLMEILEVEDLFRDEISEDEDDEDM
jgi:hypothetical protein